MKAFVPPSLKIPCLPGTPEETLESARKSPPENGVLMLRLTIVFLLIAAAGLASAEGAPVHPTLPFEGLTLVEEIDCGATAPGSTYFRQSPTGASQVQTILGRQARVMPNVSGNTPRYFAYRVGRSKGLTAGKAYVLEVEYPEDAPRAMVICNHGEASARGLFTGATLGDALKPPNVMSNDESLDMPLQGGWRTWRALFHLHNRFSDIKRLRDDLSRTQTPASGFWVIIAQYAYKDEPLSQGAAVAKIRLWEAPALSTYAADVHFPPAGLPRRHLFVREEMADAVVGLNNSSSNNKGVTTPINYYEYQARLLRFLGMNTFCKDLLEFGANQGFDSVPGGGNNWYYTAKEPTRWEKIVNMVGPYGLDLLPYYEYAGSRGEQGLGFQRRAIPLNPALTDYTHIEWAEVVRADMADPATLADAQLLLNVTMNRYKNNVSFMGAWFRERPAQMAISFNDLNFQQFSTEGYGGQAVTRTLLQTNSSAYQQYKQWWFLKRRAFLRGLRDYLRTNINADQIILYTSDATEQGRSYVPGGQPELIAENTSAWSAVGESSVTLARAVSEGRQRTALKSPRATFSTWEWQHADPENDPANYALEDGVLLTYSFNKAYTLGDAGLINEFRTRTGLAMVRHYSLNEDVMDSASAAEPLGYFVADMERTGPYIMMGEALALAKGDPRYLGYLSSGVFNRGFPEYVRAFNRAFLALPAVPGVIRSGASADPDVVVRDYATDGYGTYVAVINTARTDQAVTVNLPFRAQVTDAATGAEVDPATSSLNVELYPFEVRSYLLDKRLANGPVAADDQVTLYDNTSKEISVLSNDTGASTVTAVGTASHGTVTIVGKRVRYAPNSGFHGSDSFRYTAGNGTDTDMARVWVTVNSGTDPRPPAALQSWRQLQGLPADGSQDLASPAGDDVSNLVKFALNLAPQAGDLARPATVMPPGGLAGLPRSDVDAGGHMIFSFVRRKDEPSLIYGVEKSHDLTNWTPYFATPAVAPIDSVWERVSYTLDPSTEPNGFLRLTVDVP